jgi:hypothetical protein
MESRFDWEADSESTHLFSPIRVAMRTSANRFGRNAYPDSDVTRPALQRLPPIPTPPPSLPPASSVFAPLAGAVSSSRI